MKYTEVIEEAKVSYRLHFEDKEFPGSGYSFPCREDGTILWGILSCPETARKSLAYCKAHPERWTVDSRDGKVVKDVQRVLYLVCPRCGRRVYLRGASTAECDCGQWYSSSGQAIDPPEKLDEWDEWEEEEDYLTF